MEKNIIILIIFNIINVALIITSLSVIQWKNLHIINLICFLIMAAFDFLNLIIAIFILLKKCCCAGTTSFWFFCLSSFFYTSVNITELCCFAVFVDKLNYPCKKEEISSNSNGYYIYYYYRRLTPEYDCDNLPEDYYTGIVTKKERYVGFITLPLSLIFIIVICIFWYLTWKEYNYSCECCYCYCPSCSCSYSCCCCCNKKIKEEKKNAEVNVNNKINQKTDSNNIITNVDIEIHPTEQNSKEPIQEKIA